MMLRVSQGISESGRSPCLGTQDEPSARLGVSGLQFSHENPWIRKARTVWVKFGKKLEEFNTLAARTQSATGSYEKLECPFR